MAWSSKEELNMKKIIKFLACCCIALSSLSANADLEVISAKEAELPFALSPSKFSNSPSKFSNSISKFSNSASKFSNSPSKFDNSPSKHDNGKSGKNRLLIKKSGSYYYVGYYVWSDDGLMNFFSPKGTRLFYSPADTGAVFDGSDGKFSGTLASIKNEDVLVITESGQIAFAKEGISLSESAQKKSNSSGSYAGGGSGHWIQENIDSGSIILLEDGSLWQVDPMDKIDAMLWLPISNITIVTSSSGSPGYEYLLINTDDNEKAHAKYLGSK
jgi:hypothetical protein